jgi:methionyl-tRNA synthetase
MFVDGPPGTIGPDGKPTETVTEENYFFRLSDYQLPLLDLIESGQLHIQPDTARNEVLSFLRGNLASAMEAFMAQSDRVEIEGVFHPDDFPAAEKAGYIRKSSKGEYYVPGALKDLSISRTSFTWGIPVPGNAKHVVYVWLDALANYITAIGYGSDDPAEQAKFARYWPADLHLVGKEITRFHCLYWPAFLLAAGLPLPKSIVANGWLLFEESKMSKSRGNVVRTETILDAFGEEVYGKQFPDSTKKEQDLFAADVLRYFLLREIPFGQDGSFSFGALITRYNADLANGYGNLVSRTLTMIDKYFNATVPPAPPLASLGGLYTEEPDGLTTSPGLAAGLSVGAVETWSKTFDKFEFSKTLEETWKVITSIDHVISDNTPWKLAWKVDDHSQRKLHAILYVAAESIRIITALLYPVMPYATASVWRQLGLGDIEEAARNGELKDLKWGGLKPGTKLGPLAPIFPRADKGLAQLMTEMESPTPATPEPAQPAAAPTAATTEAAPAAGAASTHNSQLTTHNSETISIDDFAKVDLRVAQIVVAERIPKADKLLRLEVDLGPNFNPSRRQILAGIAEYYAPEALIGRKVVIVANLAPRKMRGLESQGMVVAASIGPAGAPVLAGFLEDVELGARLK